MEAAATGNWEVRHNNFAGERIPGVYASPNAGGFRSFATPTEGVQEVARLLTVYQDKHGLNTLSGIINRWAPPTDNNDTAGLIQRAAKGSGFGAAEKLNLHDPATMEKVVIEMIKGEQGGKLPVAPSIIHDAINPRGVGPSLLAAAMPAPGANVATLGPTPGSNVATLGPALGAPVPTLTAQPVTQTASAANSNGQKGEIVVRFENAPAGMRVDTKQSPAGMTLSVDVGYAMATP